MPGVEAWLAFRQILMFHCGQAVLLCAEMQSWLSNNRMFCQSIAIFWIVFWIFQWLCRDWLPLCQRLASPTVCRCCGASASSQSPSTPPFLGGLNHSTARSRFWFYVSFRFCIGFLLLNNSPPMHGSHLCMAAIYCDLYVPLVKLFDAPPNQSVLLFSTFGGCKPLLPDGWIFSTIRTIPHTLAHLWFGEKGCFFVAERNECFISAPLWTMLRLAWSQQLLLLPHSDFRPTFHSPFSNTIE